MRPCFSSGSGNSCKMTMPSRGISCRKGTIIYDIMFQRGRLRAGSKKLSIWWKGIYFLGRNFKSNNWCAKNISIRIWNCLSILFWYYHWIRSVPLRDTFPCCSRCACTNTLRLLTKELGLMVSGSGMLFSESCGPC